LGERQRLIGAYQGIALGMASRTAERFETKNVQSLVWRHDGGTIMLTTLNDGYYLMVSLGRKSLPAAAVHHCKNTRAHLDAKI
jgi:predicted regulator of Ras-like GTPase activity (Roadblock/LC7/MglB family)